jgi:hypothetical protein
MKKSILFTIFTLGLLMADGDIVADTSIYDEDGFKKTQTEQYQPPPPKITHKLDNTYLDKKANLLWQDEKYTDEEQSAYFRKLSVGKIGSWSHATSYCANLEYAGYNNWRLPTLDELLDLYEYDTGLKHSEAVDFWASTANRKDEYWSVFGADGYSHSHKEDDILHFRCVRDYTKNDTRHSASGRI